MWVPAPCLMGDRCPCRCIGSSRLANVLHELTSGRSEKEAAQALGVARNTIHVHVRRLYLGFGVTSRANFMALMLRIALQLEEPRGLVDDRIPPPRPRAAAPGTREKAMTPCGYISGFPTPCLYPA
jgi:DNA-binding CsgD family transcriptional regulator